jgi:uncharacterized membrane protein
MDEQEQIKQLQEELLQLHQQLKAQQQQIYSLHQRLSQLDKSGNKKPSVFHAAGSGQPQWTMENFIGLRLIHLIGIVVLVIGLSISVKYAIDRNLVSEGMRIALAYGASAVLYFLSWRTKKNYAVFSSILFSGAMASLYFTTYAAYVYYAMMPLWVTFIIMVALTFTTVYQAIVYNRQEIAILGLVGAYGIPFLISSNTGRIDLFFTYIAIINSAVVFLAYKKGWKLVSYLAQIITWILLLGWAMTRYELPQRWIGVVFMSLFFVLFMVNALAKRVLQQQALSVREMQQVVLNNIALYLMALLLFAPLYTTAEIGGVSLFFSLFTGAQALLLFYFFSSETYTQKMLALLSFVLLMVFIANQWDGITVTLLWLMVAVILFSWGVAGKAVWLRMSGMVLMGVTLLKLVAFDSLRFSPVQKIIAYLTLGVLLLLVGFFYQKFKEKLFGKGE